jgi:hypothetical protein
MRYSLLSPLPVAALALGALLAGCAGDDTTGPRRGDTPGRAVVPGVVFTQIERMGRPAIATVFIPTAQKDAFNTAQPVNDPAEYTDEVVNQLLAFGVDPATAAALAGALLPDILTINTGMDSGFLNGRRLQDDVIDAELMLIFGGNTALNSDNVDRNDKRFLSRFPYLAAPWRTPPR